METTGDKSEILLHKVFTMIIYIGFSTKSHKILARIFCRKFRHCAPIVIHKNRCEMYQFTNSKQINIIKIKRRDIKILITYGWVFVKYNIKSVPQNALNISAITCVQFTKKFCDIRQLKIQTPDALFKHLCKK